MLDSVIPEVGEAGAKRGELFVSGAQSYRVPPIVLVRTLSSVRAWQPAFDGCFLYVRDLGVRVSITSTGKQLEILGLNNAFRQGYGCERIAFTFGQRGSDGLREMLVSCDYHLAELLDAVAAVDFERSQPSLFGAVVTRRVTRAIRVFSPFHLERLRPLHAMPNKWTVPLVLRVLVNGQYELVTPKSGAEEECGRFALGSEWRKRKPEEVAGILSLVRCVTESLPEWCAYESEQQRKIVLCSREVAGMGIEVSFSAAAPRPIQPDFYISESCYVKRVG